MLILTILFATLFCISTFLLVRTTKNSLVLLEKVEDLDDQLDDAIKLLTEKHKKLEAKTKLEVFFDDPVVKDVVKDISDCRDIVAQIIENFNEKSSTNQTDNIK